MLGWQRAARCKLCGEAERPKLSPRQRCLQVPTINKCPHVFVNALCPLYLKYCVTLRGSRPPRALIYIYICVVCAYLLYGFVRLGRLYLFVLCAYLPLNYVWFSRIFFANMASDCVGIYRMTTYSCTLTLFLSLIGTWLKQDYLISKIYACSAEIMYRKLAFIYKYLLNTYQVLIAYLLKSFNCDSK